MVSNFFDASCNTVMTTSMHRRNISCTNNFVSQRSEFPNSNARLARNRHNFWQLNGQALMVQNIFRSFFLSRLHRINSSNSIVSCQEIGHSYDGFFAQTADMPNFDWTKM